MNTELHRAKALLGQPFPEPEQVKAAVHPVPGYAELKAKYSCALLLVLIGDFYEAFGDDAELLAKTVGLTVTGRSNGIKGGGIKMAGFPQQSLGTYMLKLIRAWHHVVVVQHPNTDGGRNAA